MILKSKNMGKGAEPHWTIDLGYKEIDFDTRHDAWQFIFYMRLIMPPVPIVNRSPCPVLHLMPELREIKKTFSIDGKKVVGG